MIRTLNNIVARYGCTTETAQRYIDLRDEGYPLGQALLMAGLSDPPDYNEEGRPATPHEIIAEFLNRTGQYVTNDVTREAALDAARAPLIAEVEALRSDAENYRWLRTQHWNDKTLTVIRGADAPLGVQTFSLDLLDDAIAVRRMGAPIPLPGSTQ